MAPSAHRTIPLLALLLGSALVLAAPTGEARADEGPVTVVASLPAGAARPVIPAEEHPMTALQVAARHGLTYRDAGTFVLLEGQTLRVRMYPGTSTVVIAGREYVVKDPTLRNEKDLVLSRRVAGFVNFKIGSYLADERVRERLLHERSTPRFEPLPPLPPTPTPVHRAPAPQRRPEAAPVALTPRPDVTAQPGWVPATAEREWQWILIHHSDDTRGNMAKYDDFHRNVRHWENGCGYHFVIGNGSLSGDGQIEIGPRWPRQLQGAHTKTPDNRYNERGIGICLVGDFNVPGGRPTAAQLDSLVRLVTWLRQRYHIAPEDVHGHGECCSTACPGKNFPWAEFRRRLR